MREHVTDAEVEAYRTNGFVVIEDFLDPGELDHWRNVVGEAVEQRRGRKFANPGRAHRR